MSSEPSEAELLRRAIESRLLDLHTSIPAVVESYDSTKQTIDARIVTKRTIRNEDGKTQFEEMPIVRNVRVKFPKGRADSGAEDGSLSRFYITWPLHKGDPIDLVCDESYAGHYRDTGIVPSESPFVGRFNLSSCWAIPGAGADSDAITDIIDDAIVIGIEGTDAQIVIRSDGDPVSPKINLGRNVTSKIALAQKTVDKLNALINALTDSSIIPAPASGPDAGETGLTAMLAAIHHAFPAPVDPEDVAAALVYGE